MLIFQKSKQKRLIKYPSVLPEQYRGAFDIGVNYYSFTCMNGLPAEMPPL